MLRSLGRVLHGACVVDNHVRMEYMCQENQSHVLPPKPQVILVKYFWSTILEAMSPVCPLQAPPWKCRKPPVLNPTQGGLITDPKKIVLI